jgi:hypothetical protein
MAGLVARNSKRFKQGKSRPFDGLIGHIGRRYLYIEAIFVFDGGLDH